MENNDTTSIAGRLTIKPLCCNISKSIKNRKTIKKQLNQLFFSPNFYILFLLFNCIQKLQQIKHHAKNTNGTKNTILLNRDFVFIFCCINRKYKKKIILEYKKAATIKKSSYFPLWFCCILCVFFPFKLLVENKEKGTKTKNTKNKMREK